MDVLMLNVTIEDAYREACTALGETIVRERLLTVELQRLSAEPEPDAEATIA
jgi:hypothetical protein